MKKIILFSLVITLCVSVSCKKFLEKKSDSNLKVPSSLEDFQKILDNPVVTSSAVPGILEIGTDDYFISYATYQTKTLNTRNGYTWEKNIWSSPSSSDWTQLYAIIYYSNVVLEGLAGFETSNATDELKKNIVKGTALFIRGFEHYFLEETFGQPYNPLTSNSDMGIPVRINSNLNSIVTRATVNATFNQITDDLKKSAGLLPNFAATRNRPSKATAFAMLARVYLTTQDYQNAKIYADSAIQISIAGGNGLYDYNQLSSLVNSTTATFANFTAPNDFPEALYGSIQINYPMIGLTTTNVDTSLYNSYSVNDLRKSLFFLKNFSTNTWYFRGNYDGLLTGRLFSGPAIDEIYLIRAESNARIGNTTEAMNDLNSLLIKRYKTGMFSPLVAANAEDALGKIITERRKELIYRALRWIDLRRLNQDPRFAVTLRRTLNGQNDSLLPNDIRYTYPIPDDEIQQSGISQNPR